MKNLNTKNIFMLSLSLLIMGTSSSFSADLVKRRLDFIKPQAGANFAETIRMNSGETVRGSQILDNGREMLGRLEERMSGRVPNLQGINEPTTKSLTEARDEFKAALDKAKVKFPKDAKIELRVTRILEGEELEKVLRSNSDLAIRAQDGHELIREHSVKFNPKSKKSIDEAFKKMSNSLLGNTDWLGEGMRNGTVRVSLKADSLGEGKKPILDQAMRTIQAKMDGAALAKILSKSTHPNSAGVVHDLLGTQKFNNLVKIANSLKIKFPAKGKVAAMAVTALFSAAVLTEPSSVQAKTISKHRLQGNQIDYSLLSGVK